MGYTFAKAGERLPEEEGVYKGTWQSWSCTIITSKGNFTVATTRGIKTMEPQKVFVYIQDGHAFITTFTNYYQ